MEVTKAFDFIEMKFPAKAEYVGVIRMSVSGIASRMGFSYEAIDDVKIAVSEAVTNVVSHAYEADGSGELMIGFAVYEDKLEIMVSDRGEGFDIEEVKQRVGPMKFKDENKPVSEIREGGFGLFLMNTLMDRVEINNEYGVIVLMTKYLDESEVDRVEEIRT